MSASDEQHPSEQQSALPSANPGYVLGQLARAFTTSKTDPEPATRTRAEGRIARWVQVFQGMLSGTLSIGSRTPVAKTPAWATLEVVKGGFATGSLLAAGPLQPHELFLLQVIPAAPEGSERAAINGFYLSDAGLPRLFELLHSGRYRIQVPEEGALLVIAWLLEQGRADEARALLDVLGPFLAQLRFYPVPAEQPLQLQTNVFRQPVSQSLAELQQVRVRPAIAREREALLVWAPLYDEAITLFAQTVEGELPRVATGPDGAPLRGPGGHYQVVGGWPCQHYPEGWRERAQVLLATYAQQRAVHQHSRKPERATENFAILREQLVRCIANPAQLTGREVGLIRAILAAFAFRRGLPGSEQLQQLREAQAHSTATPTSADLARVLVSRLGSLPQDEGLDDLGTMLTPVTNEEAGRLSVIAGAAIPATLARKVERSLAAPMEVLVARGVLPSGEALARVVPQLSATILVAGVANPDLRRLYGALYTAFRRRRSLLLFNLQHQVKFEELPWVKVLEGARTGDAEARAQARELLGRVVTLAVTAFPQQILPNTLLQEVRALAEGAGLALPVVDEVAADIFMDEFSEKYLRAAQWAGRLLRGSLYERYYGLDYDRVLRINDVKPSRYGAATSQAFIELCRELAGANAEGSRWSPARNGTIIEQEQILTTHNLAVLFDALGLAETLRPQLLTLAGRSYRWVLAELQVRRDGWHANLRSIKNAAYAWRQMVFFLSMLPDEEVQSFLVEAWDAFDSAPEAFQARFRPALAGLAAAAAAAPITAPARRFLGWTTERHWLMPQTS